MVSVDQNEEGDWTAYSPHCEYWSGQWWLSGAGDPVRSQESWIYFSCATSFLFTLSGLLHRLDTTSGCACHVLHKAKVASCIDFEW